MVQHFLFTIGSSSLDMVSVASLYIRTPFFFGGYTLSPSSIRFLNIYHILIFSLSCVISLFSIWSHLLKKFTGWLKHIKLRNKIESANDVKYSCYFLEFFLDPQTPIFFFSSFCNTNFRDSLILSLSCFCSLAQADYYY